MVNIHTTATETHIFYHITYAWESGSGFVLSQNGELTVQGAFKVTDSRGYGQ